MGKRDKKKKELKKKKEAAKRNAKRGTTQALEKTTNGVKNKNKNKNKTKSTKDIDSYRFATGILESRPLERDVKIGAFALSAYGKELIKDTSIELTIGRRYGLIGSNGSGKSTFLKCLAAREVPIPPMIDLHYLAEEAAPSDTTAIQYLLNRAESELKKLEDQVEEVLEEDPDCALLEEIYRKIDELDPNTFELRAGKLLHGLGFSYQDMHKATKDMSGGWRMRVALGLCLFIRPMLLLLDEPTNHLDLEACVWLENYLSTYPYCLVVVSHSQDFLNGVCTNIIDITPHKTLVGYTGNYDMYIKTKKENETNQTKRYKKEQDDIKHLKQFIASCGTYSNLVKQAKSKQKILDKMYAAGLTPKVVDPPKFSFVFSACEKLQPPIMTFQDVAFSYSGLKEDYLYKRLNFGLDRDSRIALVGPNGVGKSTLLKLMVGEIEGGLQPTEGLVRRHLHLNIGRYHQHSADQLDPEKTVLQFMIDYFDGRIKKEIEDWRKHIGRYGITGREQKTKIGQLSDGIKTRIVFAMLAGDRPNFLLLDEPTNHLDMQCIDALADAINKFDGGMVLVSHDFRLINQVAKEIWVCDKKTIRRWPKGIRAYKLSLMKKMKSIEKEDQQKKFHG